MILVTVLSAWAVGSGCTPREFGEIYVPDDVCDSVFIRDRIVGGWADINRSGAKLSFAYSLYPTRRKALEAALAPYEQAGAKVVHGKAIASAVGDDCSVRNPNRPAWRGEIPSEWPDDHNAMPDGNRGS